MDKEPVKTTIRLPYDLYWRMKDEMTRRRITSDASVYEAAVSLWLSASVPATEPTEVGLVPLLEQLPHAPADPLTQDVLVPILVNRKDLTWVNILLELLNSSFSAFSIAIKENLRTFLFGLISAQQVKAGVRTDEGRGTPDAEAGDRLAPGIAKLGDLLEAARRGIEGAPEAPKVVRRKTR